MLMEPVMKEDTVLIRSILPSGSAFAMSIYTGDKVFVPANVALKAQVEEGEEYDCKVLPNKFYPENSDAPLFAAFAYPLEDEDEEPALIEDTPDFPDAHFTIERKEEKDDLPPLPPGLEGCLPGEDHPDDKLANPQPEDVVALLKREGVPLTALGLYNKWTGERAERTADVKDRPLLTRVSKAAMEAFRSRDYAVEAWERRVTPDSNAGHRLFLHRDWSARTFVGIE